MSCPTGYQDGIGDACVFACPPDFKYIQEGSTQKCTYITDNSKSFIVNSLPKPTAEGSLPSAYGVESARVAAELLAIRSRIEAEKDVTRTLENAQSQGDAWNSQYGAIQSDFALYESDAEKVRDIADSLKPHRPKTAPQEDLEKERRAITEALQKNFLPIQISLFIVFVVMFVYVTLPVDYAHLIAFVLLFSGVMIGIFLRK